MTVERSDFPHENKAGVDHVTTLKTLVLLTANSSAVTTVLPSNSIASTAEHRGHHLWPSVCVISHL